WVGTYWQHEETLLVFDRARNVARDFANQKQDRSVASAKVVASIEKLARSDRRHAVRGEDWDRDLWLLNTPGGAVDLRNGELLPHDRARLMTKITNAAPSRSADCPLWFAFLDRATGGNRELQAFLQRMVGYVLTGAIKDHAIFFIWGTGGNGKSVFLNLL